MTYKLMLVLFRDGLTYVTLSKYVRWLISDACKSNVFGRETAITACWKLCKEATASCGASYCLICNLKHKFHAVLVLNLTPRWIQPYNHPEIPSLPNLLFEHFYCSSCELIEYIPLMHPTSIRYIPGSSLVRLPLTLQFLCVSEEAVRISSYN
jgi:hypothetical protein